MQSPLNSGVARVGVSGGGNRRAPKFLTF